MPNASSASSVCAIHSIRVHVIVHLGQVGPVDPKLLLVSNTHQKLGPLQNTNVTCPLSSLKASLFPKPRQSWHTLQVSNPDDLQLMT